MAHSIAAKKDPRLFFRHAVPPKELVGRAEGAGFMPGLAFHRAGIFPEALGHRCRRVTSPDHVVIYCTDGKGWARMEGRSYAVGKGEALFCFQGIPHAYGADDGDPWSISWAHFGGVRLDEIDKALGVTPLSPLLKVGADYEIAELFREIVQIFQQGFSTGKIACATAGLRYLLSRVSLSVQEQPSKTRDPRIEQAIEFMEKNIHRSPTLDEIAAHVFMSKHYFDRFFKKAMGSSPIEFFIDLKMRSACELLSSTSKRIGEISGLLGFEDSAYFSRIFRAQAGCSPREYRTM